MFLFLSQKYDKKTKINLSFPKNIPPNERPSLVHRADGAGPVALPGPAARAPVARPAALGAPGAGGAEDAPAHHVRRARAPGAYDPHVEAGHDAQGPSVGRNA